MANVVRLNPGYFPNPDRGRPVNLGDVYVGEPDLDPEVVANQKQLSVQQEDGTEVDVDQPISLSAGGVPEYNGSPVTLLVDGDYSIKVLNSSGSQVYYMPSDLSLISETFLSGWSCDLAAAVTAIGATETTLIVDCTATIASGTTVTIPSTMTLEFIRGGLIQGVAGGGAETLAYANGAQLIAAWNQNIYGANLTVTYGTSIPEAFPEHFGSIDGTSDEVQINLAITALNKGDVVLNGQSYTVDASITGATNVNLRGREGITTINIGTADIDAFSATSKTNITISGIKWNGTGANADTERLVFFDTCTDVKVEKCILTNSIIGIQFQTCTRAKVFNNYFDALLRKTDHQEGYGVLANLNNDDVQVSHNSFNGVERHCVYFSSGSDNCLASNNIAINTEGAPFVASSTDAQGVMHNIKFANNIVNGMRQHTGATDEAYGITTANYINGLQITGNQIYDNDIGGGVYVQTGSTVTNFTEDVLIQGNLIDTIDGGHGIWVQNAKKVTVTDNQINNIDIVGATFSGISIAVNGTGSGSAIDEVIIENNIVDTGVFSLTVAGVDGTHKATNVIIGDNRLSNATTRTYNMSDIDYITYKTTWDSFKPTFYVDNAAAAQTDTEMTAGNGSGYNTFVAPFSGFLYSVYGRVNGAITNEAILLELKLAGSGQTEGVTISAGDLYEKAIFGIGGSSAGKIQPITEGEIIQMQYTTAAGYLPVTLEVVGGFEIIRDINQ